MTMDGADDEGVTIATTMGAMMTNMGYGGADDDSTSATPAPPNRAPHNLRHRLVRRAPGAAAVSSSSCSMGTAGS